LLKRLKERGIQLALDDFGTGYSSLGYLNHLPFDKLKIDRSFVAGADVSAKRFQVLEGIVGLARGLGMQVVAEGVETASELSAIQALRCDAIQGFYFGRPEPQSKALSGVEAIHSNAQAYVLPDLEGEIDALDAVEKTGLGGKRKRGAA
ncbi:MAG: EAL domain-containing protein, partial [Pseudomonadota bacterium]